ncbi:hypothetical protein [Kordiimonas aquimaris]|uniref:hypothetical protein n=1 Tax=Kordiimonas aquimaris TaxID=707591 RepID=UPI0021D1FB9E|nr:hypothetical protein [Kordiimonas aquimaris]
MNIIIAKKHAQQFTKDLQGYSQPLTIEPIMVKHIDFFMQMRKSNVPWPQIATLMSDAGVYSRSGSIISPQHWAAMFSRTRRKCTNVKLQKDHDKKPQQVKQQTPTTTHKVSSNKTLQTDVIGRISRARHIRKKTQ